MNAQVIAAGPVLEPRRDEDALIGLLAMKCAAGQ
jgi:hypothetical protein